MTSLWANGLGIDTLAPLLDVLALNKGLAAVHLRDNSLHTASVVSLANVLRTHPGVTAVDLAHNPALNAAARAAIRRMVIDNRNVTDCRVEKLGPPKFVEEIRGLCAQNRRHKEARARCRRKLEREFRRLAPEGTDSVGLSELVPLHLHPFPFTVTLTLGP